MKKSLLIFTLITGLTGAGCSSNGKNTNMGLGLGAAGGAALGAVIGNKSGKSKEGAAIGALLGAGLGGVVGRRMDKQAEELEKIAETKRTEEGILTKLKSDILFDTGKADLKPAANKSLSELSAVLKKYPENVLVIKGYTDSTGSRRINEELSVKRAAAVQRQLVAGGVPAQTVSTLGMADVNPVASNDTPEGRSQNRRVEIEITVDESKVPKS